LEGGNLGFEFWGFDFFMELGIGLGIWEEWEWEWESGIEKRG
jgi:hypothetical protein